MVVLGDTGFPPIDGLAGGSKIVLGESVMEEIFCLAFNMPGYWLWYGTLLGKTCDAVGYGLARLIEVFPWAYTVETGNGEYARDDEFELGLVDTEPEADSEMVELVWNLDFSANQP
jgi:hypothetical protein